MSLKDKAKKGIIKALMSAGKSKVEAEEMFSELTSGRYSIKELKEQKAKMEGEKNESNK